MEWGRTTGHVQNSIFGSEEVAALAGKRARYLWGNEAESETDGRKFN